MGAMPVTYDEIPVRPDGFTVDDLTELPEDGRHYELVDGTLVVSPAPRWEHQAAVAALSALLRDACPDNLWVFAPAPAVRRDPRTSLEPDLSVVRRSDLVRGQAYTETPVVVAEILSPSTAGVDTTLKRHVYARLGVPFYWIVDEDEPSVTILTLTDNTYSEYVVVRGNDAVDVRSPFPVTVEPAKLVLVP